MEKTGKWTDERDYFGGLRQYASDDSTSFANIESDRIWIFKKLMERNVDGMEHSKSHLVLMNGFLVKN